MTYLDVAIREGRIVVDLGQSGSLYLLPQQARDLSNQIQVALDRHIKAAMASAPSAGTIAANRLDADLRRDMQQLAGTVQLLATRLARIEKLANMTEVRIDADAARDIETQLQADADAAYRTSADGGRGIVHLTPGERASFASCVGVMAGRLKTAIEEQETIWSKIEDRIAHAASRRGDALEANP